MNRDADRVVRWLVSACQSVLARGDGECKVCHRGFGADKSLKTYAWVDPLALRKIIACVSNLRCEQ